MFKNREHIDMQLGYGCFGVKKAIISVALYIVFNVRKVLMRVLTWNSCGGNLDKATFIINCIVKHEPDVVCIQEWPKQMFGNINYMIIDSLQETYLVRYINEGVSFGRKYILMFSLKTSILEEPFLYNYLEYDNKIKEYTEPQIRYTRSRREIKKQPNSWVIDHCQSKRLPVVATISKEGAEYTFVTWHAPRGAFGRGNDEIAMEIFSHSSLATRDNIVIAGDLNASDDFLEKYLSSDVFQGIYCGLDYIIARGRRVIEVDTIETISDHPLLVGDIQ